MPETVHPSNLPPTSFISSHPLFRLHRIPSELVNYSLPLSALGDLSFAALSGSLAQSYREMGFPNFMGQIIEFRTGRFERASASG